MAAVASVAAAQKQAAQPDPADPAAAAPFVKYESVFAGYVPFRDQELAPWRDLNDEVARAGGHTGIFGGAGRSGSTTRPPATPGKSAPGPGHGAAHK
jgi:hypothetical protein